MKNKIYALFIIIFFLFKPVLAENLDIQSSSVSIDKKTKLAIFKDNVVVLDDKENKFSTNYAEYNKDLKLLISKGETSIITSEGYSVLGSDMIFDNQNKLIKSNNKVVIKDLENNQINLDKFEYSTEENFFKSTGNIKLTDSRNNSYNFSQIYIDTRKKEILGTDIKAFLNQDSFKANEKNKPRVFANTVKIDKNISQFSKTVFTMCDYRKNDKCPPWSLQASDMSHDKKKKTIYYDNAVIKVYDFPIFYLPKLSHPDPSVDRRSGFLPPSFSDTKNLGAGFQIPYFFALGKDKDLTITSKAFVSENPLFLGEYRQAFEMSNLILDFGYTEGYKKTNATKVAGDKSHYFLKYVKNFIGKDNSSNNLQLSLQEVSNDKYLKLYRIDTDIIDHETDTLESSLSFTRENEDLFFGLSATVYETLKESYNDKYEYVLPDIVLNKNLFSSSKFGNADFTSNLNVHNYDTNKFANFFVNDIDWSSNNFLTNKFISSKFLGKIRNVNYEAQNISDYKTNSTHEVYGALGYLAEIDLFKRKSNTDHFLTPKMLLRYAPDHMRKQEIDDGIRLNHLNIFNLDRLNTYNSFEGGTNATFGFDYKMKNSNKEFDLSIGQIINQKENKRMPSSTSLDEKLSDLVGSSNYKINDNIELKYDFAIDQNYKDFNYSELSTNIKNNSIAFNFNYLQENKHIGNQDYFKTKIEFSNQTNSLFSAETKRNLITNSAEYYNLSYEYMNDCLRAGIVYRREFYNDSELEPENSLMFKVTLVPFGNINSPQMNK